jgi:hypothetical protein
MAARAGNVMAEENLALLYTEGRGLTKNFVEAAKWLRKAADQGSASAKNNLGYAFEHGLGVMQNLREALRWYREAAAEGLLEAKRNVAVLEAAAPRNLVLQNTAPDQAVELDTNTPQQ